MTGFRKRKRCHGKTMKRDLLSVMHVMSSGGVFVDSAVAMWQSEEHEKRDIARISGENGKVGLTGKMRKGAADDSPMLLSSFRGKKVVFLPCFAEHGYFENSKVIIA